MRLSVLLASAFASPVFAATRSVTVVVPPPSAWATFARVSPGCDVVVAPLAMPLTLALFFGSQERTLTESTCWMPLMRGRNDQVVLPLERRRAALGLVRGPERELVVDHQQLEVVHQREPPAEVPVGLVALLEELVDDV